MVANIAALSLIAVVILAAAGAWITDAPVWKGAVIGLAFLATFLGLTLLHVGLLALLAALIVATGTGWALRLSPAQSATIQCAAFLGLATPFVFL